MGIITTSDVKIRRKRTNDASYEAVRVSDDY